MSCRSGACRATTQNAARCGATDAAKGAFPPWFLMVKCPVGLLLQPAVVALACKCLYWENQVGSATSAVLTQQHICAHRNRPPRPTAAQTALTFVVSPRLLLRILSLCRTYPEASTNECSRPRLAGCCRPRDIRLLLCGIAHKPALKSCKSTPQKEAVPQKQASKWDANGASRWVGQQAQRAQKERRGRQSGSVASGARCRKCRAQHD